LPTTGRTLSTPSNDREVGGVESQTPAADPICGVAITK
jgi:hypothetical protein